jgi:tRNA 5-methylaminomethyl-2-thiouridine biosynthesis bifunctional protein
MKTEAIRPARIDFSDSAAPVSADFGDVYHTRTGALPQAQHVFLGGNGLPGRWRGRRRFVILETGFGLGNNFLATWQAWREDVQRCGQLVFLSIEKHPPTLADLRRAHAHSPLQAQADALAAAWPALTPNLHTLEFESGQVRLLLALGDVADWLLELVTSVDAFYLDGFAPAKNPAMWDRRLFKALARLAAPKATAASWTIARPVRDALHEAGFVVSLAPGLPPKPEMTVARYAPAFTPRRAPSRLTTQEPPSDALVIGAGLAGAWAAHTLTREGVACTVIDRHPSPGAETSGNPAGLFHGVVTPDDGAHARFNRAAALFAQRALAPLLGSVPGRIDGLLRLHPEGGGVAAMQAQLARLGLPAEHVQALDAAAASALAGVPLGSPAWFYPGGGWISPAALTKALLQGIPLTTPHQVQALRPQGQRWQALDERGHVIAEAAVVVLANAADALRLLDHPAWPVQRIRGQITLLHTDAPLPRLPIAGAGYAIALGEGQLLCGATNQPEDAEPLVREADHHSNLAQLARLLGTEIAPRGELTGRVGWRFSASDRLPVLGPVPATLLDDARLDQPRFVPRRPGLYTLTALGSRGLTWAPLAAQTLAAWITGAPIPLEASLLDVLDAARFASRAARRSGH